MESMVSPMLFGVVEIGILFLAAPEVSCA